MSDTRTSESSLENTLSLKHRNFKFMRVELFDGTSEQFFCRQFYVPGLGNYLIFLLGVSSSDIGIILPSQVDNDVKQSYTRTYFQDKLRWITLLEYALKIFSSIGK